MCTSGEMSTPPQLFGALTPNTNTQRTHNEHTTHTCTTTTHTPQSITHKRKKKHEKNKHFVFLFYIKAVALNSVLLTPSFHCCPLLLHYAVLPLGLCVCLSTMNEHTITSGINDTTSISTSNDNITCTTQEVPAVPLLDHSAGTDNNNNNNNNTNNTNNNNGTDEDHISSPTPGSDEVNLNANHVNVNNGVNDPSSSSASSLEHPPLAIIENNINHDVHGVVHGHHVGLDASVAVAPTDAGTGSNEDHIARSVQDTATVNIANSAAVAARDDVVLVHPHHHHHPSSTVAPHDHIHGDGTNHKVDDGGIPLPPLSIAVHPEQYQAQQQQQQHEHQQQVLSVATGTSEQISNTNHNITETTTTHHHHRHHQDHQQVVPVLTQQTQHHQQHQQPMVPQDPSFGFSYFAIRRGKFGLRSSIFLNWKDVERFIGGYDCAEYASFDKFDEAVTYLLSGESGADGGGTDVPVHSDAESVTENGSSGPAKKRKLGSENETRIMSTAISNDKNFSLISPFIRSPISASNPTTAASVAFTSASLSSATNHLLTGHRRRGRVKAEANPNRKPTKAWEKMYERYAKYVKEKGTLDVDPSKENADLLRWTRQQQHEYRYLKEGKASSMFQVKIDKLRDVGFEFKFVSVSFYLFLRLASILWIVLFRRSNVIFIASSLYLYTLRWKIVSLPFSNLKRNLVITIYQKHTRSLAGGSMN